MFDLIHIGDYKTGTTWLQNNVFSSHPEIIYADCSKNYPEIAKLFYELVIVRDLDFDPICLRERFQQELKKIDRAGKSLVVSRESLSGNFLSGEHARRIAERLRDVFGPVKVLLVIREQLSMLTSTYSQYVKMGGTLALRDFVFDPIVSKDLLRRLQYENQLQAYYEIFGEDQVMVKLYDELQRDNGEFLRNVFAFAGCENIHFQPEVTGVINPSLTSSGLMVQRWLNRFTRTHFNPGANLIPFDKLIAALLPEARKQRLLKSAQIQLPGTPVWQNSQLYLRYAINMGLNQRFSQWCEKIRIGHKVELPIDLKKHLHSVFASGNRILADKYGLAVDKYGWVL
jgi:hypothetical protein